MQVPKLVIGIKDNCLNKFSNIKNLLLNNFEINPWRIKIQNVETI